MLHHADGFALYGTGATGRTNMLQGVWAELTTGSMEPQNLNARSPNHSHHMRMVSGPTVARRVIAAGTLNSLGYGAAFYFHALPDANNLYYLFQARDNGNQPQFTVVVQSTGDISIKTGAHGGTEVAVTDAPVLTAGAYQHIELLADVANSGAIEVRVDGETVILETGIDLQAQGSPGCAQYAIGSADTSFAGAIDYTDVSIWDETGSVNNDFLGDVQWLPYVSTSDEPASDWTRNTGSTDFDAIDDTTPDGDTTYIEATASAEISEFLITDVPANTSEIIAIITQPMMRKTDAGAGTVQTSLLSSGSPGTDSGAAIPLTTVYTYYPEVHETDPATGIRWTPSGANAVRLRFERTV